MRSWAGALAFAMLGCGAAAAAGTAAHAPRHEFHVAPTGSDSADGSAAHPWRTLARAALGVSPGASVHVAPGRYVSGTIDARVSGTAAARIRFVSDSTWGARIFVTPASRFHVAWRQGGSFTDIVGFDVSGDGFTGIDVVGDDVRVRGNRVHDLPDAGSRGGAGILNEDGARAVIERNVVHAIGHPDSSNGLVHGIYLSRGSRGALVRENLVYGNQDAGIHAYHTAQGATIANNTVFANGNWGILVGGADGSFADSFTVANNIVFDNGGAGIVENGTTGPHNRFANNLVHGNRRGGIELLTSPAATGTLDADPGFVRYARDGTGDYRLAPGSPCLGAGVALGVPGTRDLGAFPPAGRAGAPRANRRQPLR